MTADIRAAGAVVTRRGQVLLVHRPKYDDWSFPKGKLDAGEHSTAAAVREVAEETGLDVRLGRPLRSQRYAAGRRMKTVDYWMGRVVGSDDVSGYRPNREIDEVDWVSFDDAVDLLTYPHDRTTLREALEVRRRTRTLVVLRHGHALPRKSWSGKDRRRPLLDTGSAEAERLVPILAAFGVGRVITSSSTRCLDTVLPFAESAGLPVEREDGLSEEDATQASVRDLVTAAMTEGAKDRAAVVCSHRPVLPWVFEAAGVPEVKLAPGELLVVHHRKGTVVATERHSSGA